tara:strand:+ start:2945 stop:3562 length:618 start_codon:yes stop_codon:yes gene_type:complete
VNKKQLYIIIAIMACAIGALSYQYYIQHKSLEEYKDYYKKVAVLYIQGIMEAPELKSPDPDNRPITKIDLETNILQFQDLEGNEFSLRDFEGKTLFINYWATWCNPCLAEMPAMAELYEEFKDNDNIVFLYLSKEDMDVITNYIPKDESLQKLPLYKVITDDELFKTRGTPTTFIVDKSGEILVEDVGSAAWNDEKVVNYLKSII